MHALSSVCQVSHIWQLLQEYSTVLSSCELEQQRSKRPAHFSIRSRNILASSYHCMVMFPKTTDVHLALGRLQQHKNVDEPVLQRHLHPAHLITSCSVLVCCICCSGPARNIQLEELFSVSNTDLAPLEHVLLQLAYAAACATFTPVHAI